MQSNGDLSINDYLGQNFSCACGRIHHVPIWRIIIGEAAVNGLPEILAELSCKKAFFLYDATTYSVAGEKIGRVIRKSQIPFSEYILFDAEPVPDEKTIGSVLIHFDPSCDIIIAAGSGTLNDICRFVSFRLHLPYIVMATAPSMDGYASGVAPLIVNHMKTTYEAHAPAAIIGDTDILKEAPIEMIAAGVGDILGKYTCLTDWEIAHMVNDEYYCESIAGMVKKSIHTVTGHLAIHSIMEALIMSGIAMSFAGNSRPASGSEHHLSHFWEMTFLMQGKKPILHGTKVGVATVAIVKAYEKLRERVIDFSLAKEKASDFSAEKWEACIQKTYKAASASVISLEKTAYKNAPDQVIRRIDILETGWSRIIAVMAKLPPSDTIKDILLSLQAPADPIAVGIDRETFINSFLYAKDLRNRYGLLQLLYDLGLGEEIAASVWDDYY